jgi:putative hemolysin
MDDFLKESGTKLELGRVCIDISHRNGNVIDLLWKGIGKYAELTNAKFLFGCSSVHTVDIRKSKMINEELKSEDAIGYGYDIYPQAKYVPVEEGMSDHVDLGSNVDSLVPSLLKSYLKAGAKVYGKPALDKEFECFDYMTILNLDSLTKLFKRRYFSYREA